MLGRDASNHRVPYGSEPFSIRLPWPNTEQAMGTRSIVIKGDGIDLDFDVVSVERDEVDENYALVTLAVAPMGQRPRYG